MNTSTEFKITDWNIFSVIVFFLINYLFHLIFGFEEKTLFDNYWCLTWPVWIPLVWKIFLTIFKYFIDSLIGFLEVLNLFITEFLFNLKMGFSEKRR